MTSLVRFVDSIVASPGLRLDLNNPAGTNAVAVSAEGIDLSPPPLVRAMSRSMLAQGQRVQAASFDNRTLRLPVKLVHGTTTDAVATAVQALTRELDKPSNILQVELEGASEPVFFRTLRAPDYTLTMLRLLIRERNEITLEIPAEYAGLGLIETTGAVTVSTNPAAGANGMFIDVAAVKGDTETPALIRVPTGMVAIDREVLFATRRRNTPSATPFFFQCEALTQGTDTATVANDALFSGSGNNYSLTTPGTTSMVTRLTLSSLGTASVDLRGRYRVFVRYRKNTSGDGWSIRAQWGLSGGVITTNPTVVSPNVNTLCFADLGEIQIPRGRDPVTNFRDGRDWIVSNVYHLALQAQRVSGSGTLAWDTLFLVPADDRLAIYKWVEAGAGDRWWFDAEDGSVHHRNSSDQILTAEPPYPVGPGLPLLSPGSTTRIFVLYEIGVGKTTTLTTHSIEVAYYPRYLNPLRPAAT